MAALPVLKRPDPSRLENRLFIDNQFVEATGSTSIQLHDPSTEEPTISFLSASQSDVDRAVTSSLNAFKDWSKTSPSHRSLLLRKLADLVRENAEELSSAESICMGKPANISSSLAAAAGIDHYAGLASTLEGKTDVATDGVFKLSIKQPYGVVAAIVPWNSPLLLTVNKLIPALLAGNTVIIKTSERSPLCLLALAKLCVKAGLGPGVVNVLNGGGDVGNILALHPLIRKISLTGSIPSGRSVVKASASSNLKSVGLELGGKSPSIVFSDADLSLALKSIEVSAVYNLAQVCMSTTRLLIQEEIAEEFTRRFVESYTSKVPSGSFEKSCIMGPLVDKRALKSVEGFIESARSDGGKIYDSRNSGPNGGKRLDVEDIPSKGYFIRPTVITSLGRNTRCVKEEIFGPVVVILTFKDEEEAIELANDSEYGLYGSVFTKDGARALRVAKALEVGSVGINKTSPAISLDQSFGGWKQSGWGKEMGNDALEEFLQTKSIDYVL